MVYVLTNDVYVPKCEGCCVGTPSCPKSRSSPSLALSSSSFDVTLQIVKIDSKLDTIKDFLLATHFQLDKINDATKETSVDVVSLGVKLNQVIKKAMKIIAKIKATTYALSTTIVNQFTNLKDVTANTLAYFVHRYEHPLPPSVISP